MDACLPGWGCGPCNNFFLIVTRVSSFHEGVRARLDEIGAAGLWRSHRTVESPQAPLLNIEGREVLNFCSNDYLGLAGHPSLVQAAKQGLDQYGVGAGASRLVCGHSRAHRRLEEQLAQFTGRERALVFSSGYMANLAVLGLMADRHSTIFCDRLNHASLVDGALLSGAKLRRYRHADPGSLADHLEKSTAVQKRMVVTESVFSMDGDLAPLTGIADLCLRNDVPLFVDDAHGFGVLGKTGAGALEHFNLGMREAPLLMATFGKALGVFGAFVAGAADFIECLVQTGRTCIYTTALPPALAVTAARALELVAEERWRAEKLQHLITRFRSGAAQLGLSLMDSTTAIQPLIIGDPRRTVALSENLYAQGIFIAAIRPPTVPKNTARLRISITAAHTEDQIDRLLSALAVQK